MDFGDITNVKLLSKIYNLQ